MLSKYPLRPLFENLKGNNVYVITIKCTFFVENQHQKFLSAGRLYNNNNGLQNYLNPLHTKWKRKATTELYNSLIVTKHKLCQGFCVELLTNLFYLLLLIEMASQWSTLVSFFLEIVRQDLIFQLTTTIHSIFLLAQSLWYVGHCYGSRLTCLGHIDVWRLKC